ncbi:MAG: hypothetical protein AAF805_07535 [Planctomycetota bacterium]
MSFEAIQSLQRELTDKFVVVTGDRPELARFAGRTGVVKTVNMNGRALVEFTGYHRNVGWHDLDPACLRVVDPPKPAEAPAKNKAAPASKIPGKGKVGAGKSPSDVIAAARGAKPAASQADAAGRKAKRTSPSAGKNTADILAAARAKAAAKPEASGGQTEDKPKRQSPSVGLSTADVLAAARGKKPAASNDKTTKSPIAKKKPTMSSGMTTADILAAARKKKSDDAPSDAAEAAPAAAAKPAAKPAKKKLSAADILAIARGKLDAKITPMVHTAPLAAKADLPEAGDARPDALPAPAEKTLLTAADIRELGKRGR